MSSAYRARKHAVVSGPLGQNTEEIRGRAPTRTYSESRMDWKTQKDTLKILHAKAEAMNTYERLAHQM